MESFPHHQHSASHQSRSSGNSHSSSGSSSGNSYRLILEHVLSYPGTYEIPLRHMYSINCGQVTRSASQNTTPTTSPTDAQFPSAADMTAANTQLTTALMAQISQLPSQPASLPPPFIATFVRRCFTSDVQWVDFPQSLTALDYLKDLEHRRRKEVAAVRKRLGLPQDNAATDLDNMANLYPAAVDFLRDVEVKDRRCDSLYTGLYMSLRRWILINEMSLLPYNKHNCVAMLNTLFPPVVTVAPTSKLQPDVLAIQRDGFFRYMNAVERKGPNVLVNLQMQGALPGEDSGWPDVHRNLTKYLHLASLMVAECYEVPNITHFPSSAPTGPLPQIPQLPQQNSTKQKTPPNENIHRKVDSGVSLDGQPRSAPPAVQQQPHPPPPPSAPPARSSSTSRATPPKTPATPKRTGLSTLERIARELRLFGKGKPELAEVYVPPVPPIPNTPLRSKDSFGSRSIRKMRSAGALSEISNSNVGPRTPTARLGSKKSMLFDKKALQRSFGT